MPQPDQTYKSLYDIIIRLRAPDGCPWDREQDPFSLRKCLVEESYECIEAINEQNPEHIKEELGDLFLVATFLAYIHEEKGVFSVADTLQAACDKLIRRHSHVFGEVKAKDSREAIDNWTKIKLEQEGRKPKDSILDEVSAGLPPLDRAWKLQKQAAKAGFDWPDIGGVAEKVKEELAELMEAVNEKAGGEKIEEELGDLLFSVVNLCRFLKADSSVALHRTNSKFIKRFKLVEKMMKENGLEMKQENLAIMDRYWNEAKG